MQLVTAVSYVERELYRYHSPDPDYTEEGGKYYPWIVHKKFVTVFLDGNGDPALVKYVLKRHEAQKRSGGRNYNVIYDETPLPGGKNLEATHDQVADDVLCNNKVVFDNGESIELEGSFVEKVTEIGNHDRNNDIKFVYAIHSAKAGVIDQLRNAVTLIPFPAARAVVAMNILKGFITAIGVSNFISAANFLDHRKPVFITEIWSEAFKAVVDQYDQPRYYESLGGDDLEGYGEEAFNWLK